jgi:hypothetical protein
MMYHLNLRVCVCLAVQCVCVCVCVMAKLPRMSGLSGFGHVPWKNWLAVHACRGCVECVRPRLMSRKSWCEPLVWCVVDVVRHALLRSWSESRI